MRLSKKKGRSAVVFMAALGALVLNFPTFAYAAPDYNCLSPHCYSIAAAQNNYYGAYITYSDNSITMPSAEIEALGHLNNELWFVTSADGSKYIEGGTARHCTKYSPNPVTCSSLNGLDRYIKFWAEWDSGGHEHFHLISASTTHDGNQQTLEFFNASYPNSTYNIILNGNILATTQYQTTSTGNTINVGMELFSNPTGINTNESSADFINSVYVYATSDTGFRPSILDTGTVHDPGGTGGTTSNLAMDPCSSNPTGQCLHWSLTTPNQWTDGKP